MGAFQEAGSGSIRVYTVKAEVAPAETYTFIDYGEWITL